MNTSHAFQALTAVISREVMRFARQRTRLLSALVRPALWLIVFAAGFRSVFDVSGIPPYSGDVDYQTYVVPGLLGMVVLFQGIQSALAIVYDREMGMMRLLLTAPLPRSYLLFCKLFAATVLAVLQAYAFLVICVLFGVELPPSGYLYTLPALIVAALMLASLGLLLSVTIRQLENFAGTMNFVIFPMFFISSALYPLSVYQESGSAVIYHLARFNPLTHAVELIRFAFYGQLNASATLIVLGWLVVFFLLAAWGYDPQRGLVRHVRRAA